MQLRGWKLCCCCCLAFRSCALGDVRLASGRVRCWTWVAQPTDYCASFRRVRKLKKKRRLASSCLSVRPSVRMEQTIRLPLDGFSWNLIIFRKSVQKIQIPLKPDKNNGYFIWRLVYIYDFNEFFLECEVFQKKYVQSIKTHVFCSITFPPQNRAVWDNGKIWHIRTGHRWQYGACAFHGG
jgi:hypothetical protein